MHTSLPLNGQKWILCLGKFSGIKHFKGPFGYLGKGNVTLKREICTISWTYTIHRHIAKYAQATRNVTEVFHTFMANETDLRIKAPKKLKTLKNLVNVDLY